MKHTSKASETVQTIAEQVLALSSKARHARLIAMDKDTLRVSLAEVETDRYYRNVDITYIHGRDLYRVVEYRVDRQAPPSDFITNEDGVHYSSGFETIVHQDIYFDQLGELIDGYSRH